MFTVTKFIYTNFYELTGEELKSDLKVLGVELTDIANKLGISKQALNSKLQTKDVTVSLLEDIAEAVNKNVYFFINKGKTLYGFEEEKLSVINQKPDVVYTTRQTGIPLLTAEAAAGFGNSTFSITESDIQGRYVVPDFIDIDFMLRVKGDSMEVRFSSGDVVACRILKTRTFIQWNKPYVIATKEQGLLLKRLHESKKDNHYLAVSDNQLYHPFDVPFDDITGVAIVVGVVHLE